MTSLLLLLLSPLKHYLPLVVPAPTVTHLDLIHTTTGAKIATLTNNAKIQLPSSGGSGGLSITAVTSGTTGSVVFDWDGTKDFRTESTAPFTLCGDDTVTGNSIPCSVLATPGSHVLSATPYYQKGFGGAAGTPVTVFFTLVAGPANSLLPVALLPTNNTDGFQEIFINCGGQDYVDAENHIWVSDEALNPGGEPYETEAYIAGTSDDPLYQTDRWGNLKYNIPVPPGDYQVILHFAEIYFTDPGKRKFGMVVGDVVLPPFDVIEQAGGPSKAFTREIATLVDDTGLLTIDARPSVDNPKINAIHIKLVGPHLAHSVAGGPYTVVADADDGQGMVHVDGSQSHTHGIGLVLKSFEWKLGAEVLGTEETGTFYLPVGTHDLTLKVIDSGDNESIDSAVVRVLSSDFPDISSISPNEGAMGGGDQITITGSGFLSATGVQFGLTFLSGSNIDIVSNEKIVVTSPGSNVAVPVPVSVVSLEGSSNSPSFTFIGNVPIKFSVNELVGFSKPTAVCFGPNGDLYAANLNGELGRFTLDSSFTQVVSKTISKVAGGRFILGIAFDPMETADTADPTVYISSSKAFHGEDRDSYGNAINGKIMAVNGANLDDVSDVVTGLPVSDHDHAINGIEFGDNGELYIQIGGNTNGGIPGELSGSQKMKENYFSAATLVANIGHPNFDGDIAYTDDSEGAPKSGFGQDGVEIYAPGMRNPYGIVKHSNGKLYGTDNGPNGGFGDMATGCNSGQQIPDKYKKDELNLIEKGKWYGHPNFARVKHDGDSKQCVWNGDGHTPPLMELNSSTDGIVEFQSDHFGGQMRGNLIMSKYKDGLYRVILTDDGERVDPSTNPASFLAGDNGLDITQAPNGMLVDARLPENSIHYYKPEEPSTSALQIKSVFPRRGPAVGGSTLNIYGVNFPAGTPSVEVGGKVCGSAVRISDTHVKCNLPGGGQGSSVDVAVTISGNSDTMLKAYRYIKGSP